jgi:hypothetical protein
MKDSMIEAIIDTFQPTLPLRYLMFRPPTVGMLKLLDTGMTQCLVP